MKAAIPEASQNYRAEFLAFRSALSEESDRGCVLFAAAYLDTALEGLFRASVLEEKKIDEELFEGSAPLATFSGRIKLAYYFGFISAEFRADLETIRKIRNDFAHNATILSFDTQSIADRCRNLGFSYHEPDARPRAHFTSAVTGLVSTICVLTLNAKRATPKPDDRPSDEQKAAVRKIIQAAAETAMQTVQEKPAQ